MSRPLRIEIENGIYHVTARGWERRLIVRDDRDRQESLELLDRVVVLRCGWRFFAWALMNNHFHLFFQTPEANLSAGMHDLNLACRRSGCPVSLSVASCPVGRPQDHNTHIPQTSSKSSAVCDHCDRSIIVSGEPACVSCRVCTGARAASRPPPQTVLCVGPCREWLRNLMVPTRQLTHAGSPVSQNKRNKRKTQTSRAGDTLNRKEASRRSRS